MFGRRGVRRLGLVVAGLVGLQVAAVVTTETAVAAVPASPPAAVNPAPVVRTVTTPGPTVVSNGLIATDTVWGPLGSPYVLKGRLKIEERASLTLLPGTVIKLDSGTDHYAEISVDGQLLSLGTPAQHVVITSIKDDTVAGDTNGDGSASQPKAGDWYQVRLYGSSLEPATKRPVSVLDYTDVRYGGWGSSIACQSYAAVGTNSSAARLIVSNSSITDSMINGLSTNADPAALGFVGVYNSRFARSQCGISAMGGAVDAVGNTFENSFSMHGFFALGAKKSRFWFNTVNSRMAVSAPGTAPTRAMVDVRYNHIAGGIGSYGASYEQLQDYSTNWWGYNLNTQKPPACATTSEASAASPQWTLNTATQCPDGSRGKYPVTGYVKAVQPALSGAPAPVPGGVNETSAPRYGPVDAQSGVLTYQASDLAVQDAGKQVTATRTYRSDTTSGDAGAGWSSAFSEALSTVNGTATMSTADGRSVSFGMDPAAGYTPAPGVSAGFSSDANGSQVTTPGQDTYQFDPGGALTGMLLGDAGHKVDIARTEGQLDRVTGVSGRFLAYTRSGGKLRSVNDATGRSAGFAYTDDRLAAATGVDGKTETYSYDGNGRLTKVTTPSGRTKLAAEYDANGKVVWVEQEGTGRSTFHYDPANRRTTIDLPDGSHVQQDYDAGGRLVVDQVVGGSGRHVVYDGEGRAVTVVTGVPTVPMTGYGPAASTTLFDSNGDPATKVDPQGLVVRSTFAAHQPLVTTFGDGTTITRTYDGAGRLATVTDQRGKLWRYAFNSRGQLIGRTDPLGRNATYDYAANGDRAGVTDETGAVTTYDNDPQGRPVATTDPLGRRRTITYTTWDEPERITQPRGGTYAITFDEDRRKTTSSDPSGTTRYEYDGAGRLAVSIDPAGGRTTVEYDAAGRPVKVTDPRGGVVTRQYSVEGWPTQVTDPADAVTRTEYDPAGRSIRIIDALGQVVQTMYDRAGRAVKVQTPDGATRSFAYNLLGRLTQSTTPLGRKWLQAYDAAGNPTVTTDPLGKTVVVAYDDLGRQISRTDQAGVVSTIGYDDAARTTTVSDPLGVVQMTFTDAAGQVIRTVDGRGAATTIEYDADGNLVKQTDPTGAPTSIGYDLAGHATSAADPLGRTTSGEYDSLGRLTKRTWPDAAVETFAYDAVGNLTRRTDRIGAAWTYAYDAANHAVGAKDPLGNETSYAYDALGRMTRSTDPTGVVQAIGYDPAGRAAVRSDATGASWVDTYDLDGNVLTSTDPAGVKVTNVYDVLGRLTKVTSFGYARESTYDAMGHLVAYDDEYNQISKFEYDVRGRQTASVNPLQQRTTYGYDAAGNVLTVTPPSGHTRTRTYDQAGRVLTAADALGNTSRYTYDAAGELTTLTLPRGGTYTYSYDATGRTSSEVDPRGATTRFSYDGAGRLTGTTYPSGRVVANNYDAAGRLTQRIAGTDTRTYGYDAAGRLTSAGNLGFGYDNRGLLSRSTDALGDTTYAYDAAQRLSARTPPGGATTTFLYGTSGLLSQVRGGTNLNYTYDYSLRQVTKTSVSPTAGNETRTLDAARRPTSVKSGGGTYVVSAQYSPDGQISSLTQTMPGNAASNTTAFGYDDAGRLTSAGTTTYAWDADGNRTSASGVVSAYDEAGHLTGASDGSTYTYDADGNLTDATRSGVSTHYDYNAFGELTSARNGTVSVTYGRDALGRTSTSRGNALSYNGTSTELSQYRAGGTKTDLVRDPSGALLAEATQNGGSARVWQTLHGDIGMLANAATGAVQHTSVYDAFGNATKTGTAPVPLGFQSMLTDSGLVDMGARSYDPATGRFTTVDDVVGDLTSPVTLNRYTYANADPLNYFDPDGHWSLPSWNDVTSFVKQAADWVGDRLDEAGSAIGEAATQAGSAVSEAWSAARGAASTVADVVQHHAAPIVTNIQNTVYHLTHDPKAALATVASVAAGAVTFLGCAALTAGVGSFGCVVAAFTVGGAVGGALDCPDGQAILSCAAVGGVSGAVSGVVAYATGGMGTVAAGALSSAAGSAAGQYLTTGRVDLDQVAAGALLGAAMPGAGKLAGPARNMTSRATAAAGRTWSGLKDRAGTVLANDRGSIRLGGGAGTPRRDPIFADTDLMVNAQKGHQGALDEIRAGTTYVTPNQYREFLAGGPGRREFMQEEGIELFDGARAAQVAGTSEFQTAFNSVRDAQGRGDAALCAFACATGYTAVTMEKRLFNFVTKTLKNSPIPIRRVMP
ncbi:hypothetical protein Lesp02_23530 [Lentzea sp. NBRC 105346]|uniref:RHS repeat-associated core domain-containing protein n=1 Tax=Lentzea sp. NBRC 105346 TaxID=3032205 RepID=UPI0024A3B994|nr:RHS repeat-associated core domain-containing protein [Lentzea sp. NBRC 105346]GLZ30163.1 hypothetical protein Lesp02_23530 [Lentzea sp. NBRC 105346]